MLKTLIAAGAIFALITVAGCDRSAEKSGEKLDSTIENATQGHVNTSDGPLEQTGESIDRATGQTRHDDVADSLNDATDGNKATKP